MNNMKICSVLPILLSLTLLSCKSTPEKETVSDTICTDTKTNIVNLETNQIRDSETNQNEYEPMYYDYLDKESYRQMVKKNLMYERKNLNLSIDSAIILYSSDLIPSDSIIKWWNMIPSKF